MIGTENNLNMMQYFLLTKNTIHIIDKLFSHNIWIKTILIEFTHLLGILSYTSMRKN